MLSGEATNTNLCVLNSGEATKSLVICFIVEKCDTLGRLYNGYIPLPKGIRTVVGSYPTSDNSKARVAQ